MKRLVKRIIRLEKPAMVQDEIVTYLEEVEDEPNAEAISEDTRFNDRKDG